MHLQVRSGTTKTTQSVGAMAASGGLVEILEILARAEISLAAAGGRDLDGTGEFTFAVEHGAEHEAVRLLREAGYSARAVDLGEPFKVAPDDKDKHGILLEHIRRLEEEGQQVYEIVIGVPGPEGEIPIQLATRPAVRREVESGPETTS